jgi:hypothetical protein
MIIFHYKEVYLNFMGWIKLHVLNATTLENNMI